MARRSYPLTRQVEVRVEAEGLGRFVAAAFVGQQLFALAEATAFDAALGAAEQAFVARGELFVAYQLAAQKLRPDVTVCLAAYGDCGTGYVGTEIPYSQGGYETQPTSSSTAPTVERVLLDGRRALLE